jgi:hypothetical protein
MGVTCHTLACNLNAVGRELDLADFAPKPRFRVSRRGSLVLEPTPISDPTEARPWIADPLASFALQREDHCYERLRIESPFADRSAALRLGIVAAHWLDSRYLDPNRPYLRTRSGSICNVHSPAFRITTELMRRFARASQEKGRAPLLVVLPDVDGLRQSASGYAATCEPLLAFCRRAELECLDASEALLASEQRGIEVFGAGGHYSAAGNAELARWLTPHLIAHAD